MIAKEIMTSDVIKISSSASIGEAVSLLREHTISGLPVVDNENRLVGVITGGDVLRSIQQRAQKVYHTLLGPTHVVIDEEVWRKDRDQLLQQSVAKMMSRSPITVTPDTPVGEIADLMLRQSIRRVFVIDQSRMIGVVTRNDIVRWLVSHVGGA